MDAVPHKFVDAVVELFDENKTLDNFYWNLDIEKLKCALWRRVLTFHKRERRSYDVCYWKVEDGIECAFELSSAYKERIFQTISEVEQIDPRFLRIIRFSNYIDVDTPPSEKVLKVRQGDQKKLQKFLSRKLVDCNFADLNVYFTTLQLYYVGQIAEDFLKDHIDNHSALKDVELRGEWPDSILPYINKFCCQTEMSRKVRFQDFKMSTEFLQEFLDYWRANGTDFNCKLSYYQSEAELGFLEDWNFTRTEGRLPVYYLKHDECKSVIVALFAGSLYFRKCLCDTKPMECEILKYWPEIHERLEF